jgi:hypothetical protein
MLSKPSPATPVSKRFVSRAPEGYECPTHKSNAGKGFDISKAALHDDFVRSLARTSVLLVAAALLTWHGVLLATPHDHADSSVPQEELLCSASHPSSQSSHLHGSGRLLLPHPCLACLAGTTVVDMIGISGIAGADVDQLFVKATATDLRPSFQALLPPLRGPPQTT